MKNRNTRFLTTLLVTMVIFMVMSSMLDFGKTQSKYKYSEIIAFFDEGKVESYSIDLGSGELLFKLRGEEQQQSYTVPNVNLFYDQVQKKVDEYNRDKAAADKIPFDLKPVSAMSDWLSWAPSLILLVVMGVMFYFTIKQTRGGGNISGFGKAKTRVPEQGKRVTFNDVAGAEEEKHELVEVVDFLKNPGKFNMLGARIPKGILLVGPPGTGKTLLAKAVAGEAGAPFFSISGSDFVEMFVGVGASRVRDLFDQAKKSAPAIIFIDEIDAVGRQRGAGLGGGHDEREQTLNQLLVEMDGFGSNTGVIVMAATNRRDILDPALLRPGRFDRQVYVGYPDIKGREAILRVHARNKPLGPDVELRTIAASTAGFTGADLENLLNEAALLSARNSLKAITMPMIEEATIKVIAGPEKKSRLVTEKDKRLTAYHEAGHAVVTYYMSTADKVHQVSIIPRGMAGGYTMSLPSEDKSYRTKTEMLENIVTLLGGRVAESLILDDISTGASNDLQRVTAIARSMVTRYGFSDKLGTVVYGTDPSEVFLGRSLSHERDYSEGIAAEIDSEIRTIIHGAYESCKQTLTEHLDQLHLIANALMEHEKIDEFDFASLMTTGKMPDNKDRIADAPADAEQLTMNEVSQQAEDAVVLLQEQREADAPTDTEVIEQNTSPESLAEEETEQLPEEPQE